MGGDDNSPLKKMAKKSIGSPSRPSGTKREMDSSVESQRTDSPKIKRSKSPSPDAAPSRPFVLAADKERPYKCPECDKTFTRGNHLKDHMRLHAGETYECPVCQYQCILQTKFTHHLTSHNNQGPFPCAQCGRSFDRAHD